MGNFEDAIPKNIAFLERELGAVRRKLWSLQKEFEHDCNCEYCTVEPEDPTEEAQKELDRLDAEMDDIKLTISRLKRHAEINGVKV